MKGSYGKLALALALSYVVMFVLTMSMIRQLDHFYLNLSNAYMALIMVAPMGVIMLVVMWSMYTSAKVNVALILGFTALFLGALFFGRQEAGVGNEQFLRSMIPHHSRAILVCQEADITDQETADLCDAIIQTQREEIAQMEQILQRLDG